MTVQDQGQERDVKTGSRSVGCWCKTSSYNPSLQQGAGPELALSLNLGSLLPPSKVETGRSHLTVLHSNLIQGHTRVGADLQHQQIKPLMGRHSWKSSLQIMMVTADQGNWSLLVCSRQQRDKTMLRSLNEMTTLLKYNWTWSWKM